MTGHVDDLLPGYAAGLLPGELVDEVEAHLGRCGTCAAELRALEEVYATLPLALPPVVPPPGLRGRILGTVRAEGRFERFVDRVAALLDVAGARARELLARIDRASSWVVGPEGTRLVHLEVGPRVAHANCGLVRLPAGAHFPKHRHLGQEHVLVLQGGFVDSSGRTLCAGDEEVKPAGSEHSFTALAGADLVYLVVLEEGFQVIGGGTPDL
jgi:quercetin dioxygenase-like cupin family protein